MIVQSEKFDPDPYGDEEKKEMRGIFRKTIEKLPGMIIGLSEVIKIRSVNRAREFKYIICLFALFYKYYICLKMTDVR